MRSDHLLAALGAAGFTLSQGAMALGHCATLMLPDGHRDHIAMGHEMPPDDEPADDAMKGCHACLRKRTPIKDSAIRG